MNKKNDDAAAPSTLGSRGLSVMTAAPIAAVLLVTVAATAMLLEAPSQMLQVGFSISVIVIFQVAASLLSLERESKRRLQHVTTGLCFVMAPKFFPLPPLIIAMLVAAAGIWYLAKFQRDTFLSFFGGLLRPVEVKSGLPGAFYFIIGTVAVWTLFSLDVANYSLLCLSVADPIAASVGQSIRSPRLTLSSSVAGSFACFATAWIIGLVTLGQEGYSMWSILRGAVVCTVAEAIALPGGLNDNLLIPILTGFAIKGIQRPNY